MPKRIYLKFALLSLLSFVSSSSLTPAPVLAQTDPETKCEFIGYLAYEISLYRDAGMDRFSASSNLTHKYMDNPKISELIPLYVKQLYTEEALRTDNIHDTIKHRCLQQYSALHSQQRY